MVSTESAEVLRLNNELRDAWLADPNYTFDDMRRIFEEWLARIVIPPEATFAKVDCGGVSCIWADAPGADPERVVMHCHSGGYLLGSAHGYRSFGGYLSAASGCRVLLVGYRLAPENPWPAGVNDGVAAFRWLEAEG